MPRSRETKTTGYLHCTDALCSGHRQEPVPVFRVETEFTYMEKGGDAPGVENSTVHFRIDAPRDEIDGILQCPGCGRNREVSDQARKVYQPLSGHSPDGLLKFGPYDPAKQVEDPRIAALEAQVAKLVEALGERTAA